MEFSWPTKPKLHAYDHLIRRVLSTRFNPASVWEFADEDLNGKLVRVTRTGSFAISKRTYVKRICQCWRLKLLLTCIRPKRHIGR